MKHLLTIGIFGKVQVQISITQLI